MPTSAQRTRECADVRVVNNPDQAGWAALCERVGGQLHQSWTWGAFKERHGWDVERIAAQAEGSAAIAQVLFKRRGPVSTAFIPLGPIVEGDDCRLLPAIWQEVERACRRHRAVNLVVERPFDCSNHMLPHRWGVTELPMRHTPLRTVIIPLDEDEALLKAMHPSKRREIRKAERRGITIETDRSPHAVRAFHDMLIDTSRRNRFPINGVEYYADFLKVFGDNATLRLAVVDGSIAAGLIAARAGGEATYMFGASSSEHRVPGATAYLQFSAMQWARKHGCSHYDLWGIPDYDPPSYVDDDKRPIRSIGNNDAGLYRFKVELGGEIVTRPPGFEVPWYPRVWWAACRAKELRHALRK